MKRQILTLILLTMAGSAMQAQNSQRSRPPIIGVHMHVYAKDNRWRREGPAAGHHSTWPTIQQRRAPDAPSRGLPIEHRKCEGLRYII